MKRNIIVIFLFFLYIQCEKIENIKNELKNESKNKAKQNELRQIENIHEESQKIDSNSREINKDSYDNKNQTNNFDNNNETSYLNNNGTNGTLANVKNTLRLFFKQDDDLNLYIILGGITLTFLIILVTTILVIVILKKRKKQFIKLTEEMAKNKQNNISVLSMTESKK